MVHFVPVDSEIIGSKRHLTHSPRRPEELFQSPVHRGPATARLTTGLASCDLCGGRPRSVHTRRWVHSVGISWWIQRSVGFYRESSSWHTVGCQYLLNRLIEWMTIKGKKWMVDGENVKARKSKLCQRLQQWKPVRKRQSEGLKVNQGRGRGKKATMTKIMLNQKNSLS